MVKHFKLENYLLEPLTSADVELRRRSSQLYLTWEGLSEYYYMAPRVPTSSRSFHHSLFLEHHGVSRQDLHSLPTDLLWYIL
jgi:hypothetical protein